MINMYKCNSLEDYRTLLSMFPDIRWKNDSEYAIGLNFSTPSVCYVSTETTPPIIDISTIEIAQFNADEFPNHYQFAELVPQLNVIDVLRTFLKHHNVYEEFKHLSLTSRLCTPKEHTIASQAIDRCGFMWTDYRTDFYTWSQLEQKWKQLCKNFNISTVEIGEYHNELFSKD